jgi:hypothetical protein
VDAELLLSLHDEVKGVIMVWAVFLTGIAGDTLLKNTGMFTPPELDMLILCFLQIHTDILAARDAVARRAPIADLRVE